MKRKNYTNKDISLSKKKSNPMLNVLIDGETLETKLGFKQSYIERVLGLPMRSLKDKKFLELPESQALLKIIYILPWILEAAEFNFNPEKTALLLQREAINIKLRE